MLRDKLLGKMLGIQFYVDIYLRGRVRSGPIEGVFEGGAGVMHRRPNSSWVSSVGKRSEIICTSCIAV